jgi:hypothetical protein
MWEANLKRKLVDDKTTVGRAFENFARSLCGEAVETKPKNRLFGLFSAA